MATSELSSRRKRDFDFSTISLSGGVNVSFIWQEKLEKNVQTRSTYSWNI